MGAKGRKESSCPVTMHVLLAWPSGENAVVISFAHAQFLTRLDRRRVSGGRGGPIRMDVFRPPCSSRTRVDQAPLWPQNKSGFVIRFRIIGLVRVRVHLSHLSYPAANITIAIRRACGVSPFVTVLVVHAQISTPHDSLDCVIQLYIATLFYIVFPDA